MEFKQMKGGVAKLGDKLGFNPDKLIGPESKETKARLKMPAVTNPSIPTN